MCNQSAAGTEQSTSYVIIETKLHVKIELTLISVAIEKGIY